MRSGVRHLEPLYLQRDEETLLPEPQGHSEGIKERNYEDDRPDLCWDLTVEILRSLHLRGSQDCCSTTVMILWCRSCERTKTTAQRTAWEPFDLAGGIQIDRLASSPGKASTRAGRVWSDMERPGKRHRQHGSMKGQLPDSLQLLSRFDAFDVGKECAPCRILFKPPFYSSRH